MSLDRHTSIALESHQEDSMAKTPRSGPGTKDDVEDIIGLFLMTFGQGVNPLHVHLAVVRAIRARLIPSITNALKDPDWRDKWKAEAATVLGWMAAVGRLAAQVAMEPKDRRTVVNPSDFKVAMEVVTSEHGFLEGEASERLKILGKWCM
jgi:hypothetical protein